MEEVGPGGFCRLGRKKSVWRMCKEVAPERKYV